MKAVIPVAGIGSRLKPHTYFLPKVLLNVAGKPILKHILDDLLTLDLEEIILVTGHLGDDIEKYVRSNFTANFRFVSQEEPLGLGHAIWCASEYFDGQPLIIILGDTIFEIDFNNFLKNKECSSLGVKEVDDPSRFGVVVTNEKGEITKLVEKPENFISNLAIVGVYYINNSDLLSICLDELLEKQIKTRGEFQLTDALQLMIDKGEKFLTFPVEGWYDCGKPETLLLTNKHLLTRNTFYGNLPDCVIIPPVYIAEDAIVKRSVIGPFTTIASGAKVIDSVIKNSIISDGASVESYLLDSSIIGNDAIVQGSFYQINVGNASEIII
ncbi:MAG: sugar phosphate nucleotidyltransferase [Ignavibacteria bacterium]|nr:sugar phosphate nucleotidyltransferase [Ignavibacteria bacterium]